MPDYSNDLFEITIGSKYFSINRFESQKRCAMFAGLNPAFTRSYGFQILQIIQMKHPKDQYNNCQYSN